MHKIIKISFLFAAILGLSSCLNNITIDKRWIPENQDKQGDGLHTVLVEEYTGQKCVNCPSAAEELAKISEDYPGRIITVAMHATFSGQTNPELSSSCANEYAKYYNLPKSVPGIMIDRSVLSDDNKYYQQRGLWNSLISKALSRSALYRLELKAELRPEHKIKLNVKAELLSGKKDTLDLALQLWVVEDIIAEQQTLTGKKADYFHHNVLRCHLNGIYGSDFNLTKPYNAEVNMPRCVKDENNTKLIAFIFDRNTYEIYESVIVKLGKGITEQDNKQETPQEKPQEKPQEEVENISFKSNNTALASGSELEITAVELTGENKDRIEMETPVISVISSKKNSNKKYAVEIVKQDHKGAEFGGLSQICLENCQDSDNTESFVQKEVALTDQSIVMVHYQIAEKYKDKITVLCGFEADYIKGISKPSLTEDYAELKPDYLIGSVHYVVINDKIFAVDDSAENLAVSIRDYCGGKAEIAVKEYFALEREMLSKGVFTILGHADLIRKNNGKLCMFNEKDEWYRNEIKTLADCIKRAGVIAEINTGAISRGTMDDIYPSEELLHLLHERNIPITVNSDAHSCSALDCAFERAFFKAKKAGYSELAYLDSGSNIKFQKLDFNSI